MEFTRGEKSRDGVAGLGGDRETQRQYREEMAEYSAAWDKRPIEWNGSSTEEPRGDKERTRLDRERRGGAMKRDGQGNEMTAVIWKCTASKRIGREERRPEEEWKGQALNGGEADAPGKDGRRDGRAQL